MLRELQFEMWIGDAAETHPDEAGMVQSAAAGYFSAPSRCSNRRS
jgi:hypothetical protein